MLINNNNNNSNSNSSDKNIETEKQIIKRNDAQFVFSYLTREISFIHDGDKSTKRQSIANLHHFFINEKPSLKPELIQEILIAFNKNFIKLALFDAIDKCREYSLKILIYLYSNCTNVTKFFPFIFSGLVDKLDCSDLEGVSALPEDIRPTPSQKPHKVVQVTEPIEEIRILYLKLLEALIFRNEPAIEDNENPSYLSIKIPELDDFRVFVQDIVNISRTLCMDQCTAVTLESCYFIKQLAIHFNKELLFYFNTILTRALLYPLSHKQAKLRIASLEALDKLMLCSPFKKNYEIMEQLIGFRDPNLVPIKDFYEPSTKLNYLALLVSDSNYAVLKCFFQVITNWMLALEDRADHESRLIPYVLTGLFDNNEEIALYVCERLEMIGQQYEIDNEKDIRDMRQFGVDAPWVQLCTNENKDNNTIPNYPFPLAKRPRLGSRLIIRKYLRRFIKNMCKEFETIDDNIKIRVSNLILFSIVYSEDIIVEFLDQIFFCFQRELIKFSSMTLAKTLISTHVISKAKTSYLNSEQIIHPISKSLKFIGRFCDYDSITKLIYPTIEGELNGNYSDMQRGALLCLKYIFEGHLESIGQGQGFGIFNNKFDEMINVINCDKFIAYLDSITSVDLLEFYQSMINSINIHSEKLGKDIAQFIEVLDRIFYHLVQAFGSLEIFEKGELLAYVDKILSKINADILDIFAKFKFNTMCTDNNNNNSNAMNNQVSFFSYKAQETLKEISKYLENNYVSIHNKYYKILYIFLKSKLFIRDITTNDPIFLLLEIFNKIFQNDENYTVHLDAVKNMINFLTGCEIKFNVQLSSQQSFQCGYISQNNELVLRNLDLLISILGNIIKPYEKLEGEKFKFADLLKDKSELEKKKLKSPRTLKTELRWNALLLIKHFFSHNSLFDISSTNDNDIGEKKILACGLLKILSNREIIEAFIHEEEKNREQFATVYYQFFIKYFTIFKNDTTKEEFKTNLKFITQNFEIFFLEEVYDSMIEIRQMCFSIFNVILSAIPKSEFYEPMCGVFTSEDDDNTNASAFSFEALKAIAYIEDENKLVSVYFHNFKLFFGVITNLYLDEKSKFGSLCDTTMKLIIERFPIYVFNELLNAQKKNQMGRMEFLTKMLKKHLKH